MTKVYSIQDQCVDESKLFDKLFEENYEILCNYAYMVLGDYDEAEDLVQEIFAKVWINKDQYSLEDTNLGYFYRAIKNGFLNKQRHGQVKAKFEDDLTYDAKNFVEVLTDFDLPTRIDESIEKLPEQCQKIFRMSRYEGFSYKEIAKKLQISESTVNTQIYRALKVLKTDLKDYLIIIIAFFLKNF
ncbi:RNA polymerase sigma-70 factor [Puteibacter caeruleilacunae]|nr:RNA polymerase sigma-70 factor [Puteibacter caeruleilacunae]